LGGGGLTRVAAGTTILGVRIRARHRRAIGDLSDLKTSMATLGLLHPIVVNERRVLIAGERRLRAAQALGWRTVPIRVVRTIDDALQALRAERDENTCRRDFQPSEAVALARDLEPFERKEAEARHAQGVKAGGKARHGKSAGNSRTAKREPVAKDKIAAAVGVDRKTLAKAEAVVAAAEAEPEKYERLREQMDRTGNIHGAYKQLEKAKQAEAIRAEPPPLPTGPFRVIIADPPWQYDLRAADLSHRASLPYPEMSIAAICALPVQTIATEDAVLWLWTTNAHMRDSYAVLDAWGFESKTILTWGKQKIGVGNWLRGQTEHCHLAVRGKPIVQLTNQSTLLFADAGAHSAKPDAFYELVEALCPGSKVELFQRTSRPGITGHGDEIARTA
jgi:N6-adenosine-specific RNA methylase IME4/ParB-like chromosome segregation protein Spo0J